uniref:Uncharacterized protein n=1 Tax=Chromera velia CCMP2878 TaxID=1169474 RepID=A0A0K6S8G0_9ALVE|eukprot:Cvel_25615.t1-p1 / transcript=Cvel_25615.t1 / gene=Cvel_25615 / organism=Chromera_velia_CCMP2878 / gene_product=hypothetical protein / transcript_product=hypothetical protein / location=Cvel_scaffold2925:12984-15500(-) / protein_length=839 / sequence_SO=supercontig / SO=protein_coding / is_pseudo=false
MTQIRADMIRNSTLGHTPATPPQRHRTSSEHSTPQTAQTASGGVRRPVERQQGGGTASRRNRRAISTDGDETVQVSSREGSNRHQMQQQQPGGSQRGFLGLTFPRRGGNRTTAGRTPPPTPPRHLQFRGLETVPSNDLSGYSSSSGFSRISEGNGGSGDSLPLSLTQRGGGDVSKGRERGGQGKREKGENSSRIDAGPVTPTARSQVGTLSDDRDTGSPTVPLKYGTSQGAMAAAEGNQGAILALAAAGHGGYLTATLGEAQDELTSRSRRPSLLNESSLGSNASLSVPMQYGRGAPPTFTPSRLAAEVVREGGDNAEGEGGGREKAAMVSTPSDGGEGSGGLIRDPRLAPSGVTEQEEGDGMRGGGGFDSVYASSHHNRSQIVGDEQRQRPRETSKTSQGGEKEQRERGIGGIFLGVEAQRQAGGRVGGGQSSEQFERPGRSSPAESHPESAARTVWRHPLHPQSPPAVEVPFSFTDETERKKEQQGEEERESGWRNSDCLPSPSLLDTEREREVHADPQHNAAPPSTSSSSVFSSSPRHRPPPADAKSAKDAEWKQRKPPDPGSPNEQEAAFPSGPFASCDEEERQSEGMNSSSSSSSERLSSGAFQSAWGGESSLSLSSLHDPKESSREGEGDQDTRNSETLGARVSFLPLSISLRSQHTTATGEEDNAERAGAAEGHHFNFEGDMRGKESVSPCVAFRKVRLSAEDGGDDFEIERSPRSLFRFPPPFSIEKGQQNGREWTEENGMTGDEWGYKGVYRKGIFRERENLFGGLGGAPTMQQIHIGPFVSREEKRTSRLSEGCEMSRRGRHVNIGDGSVVNPTDIFLSLSVSDLNDMV